MNVAVFIVILIIILIIVVLALSLNKLKNKAKEEYKIKNELIKILTILKRFLPNLELPCPNTKHFLHDLLSRYLKIETADNKIIDEITKYFLNKNVTIDQTNQMFRIFLQELLDEQFAFHTDLEGFWLGPGNSSSVSLENTISKYFLCMFKSKEFLSKGYPYHFFLALPTLSYQKNIKKSFYNKINHLIQNHSLKSDFGHKGVIGPKILILFFNNLFSKDTEFTLFFDGYFLHAVCFSEEGKDFIVMEANNPLTTDSLKKYKNKNCLVEFLIYKKVGVEILK